jgi:hypothetical protein
MTRWIVIASTAVAVGVLPLPARGQQLLLSGDFAVASGVEGGDTGTGATALRRARTRIEAGGETRTDEDSIESFGLRAFAEVEPHTSLGGEVRYVRWLAPMFSGFAGFTGVIAPHTLFGAVAGADFYIPLGKSISIFIEPSFAALPFGTELPSDHVLIWGLLSVGVRGNFISVTPVKHEAAK